MNQAERTRLRAEGYWVPNAGPQEIAVSLANDPSIFEIFFGGSRGPGKTAGGQGWLTKDMKNPRMRALVIRKNAEDLADWVDRSRQMYAPFKAEFAGKPVVGRVPNGAIIRSGHLKDDDAYTKYQGHEYHRMLIEELTQIPNEKRYLQLIASCRSAVPGLAPQVFITANPGGVGHLWVRNRFVDPDPETNDIDNRTYHYTNEKGETKVCYYKIITDKLTGMKRAYIPATLDDNPILKDNDPNYVKQLDALQTTDPELYKAWRFGEWNIFAGQVFKEWKPVKNGKEYHVINRLPTYVDVDDGQYHSILDTCQIYAALDWGYNDAFSCHWIAVTPEDGRGIKRYYVYRELTGNEKRPKEWAREIADIVKNEPIEFLVMPHDTYNNTGGTRPIEQQFREAFDEYGLERNIDGQLLYPNMHISMQYGEAKSHISKINRQALLHEVLAEAPDGLPYLQVTEANKKLIETLPSLPYSDTKPEEIDDKSEDHYYDSLTYGLYKIFGGKAFVPATERIDQRDHSFMVDSAGQTQGLHIDISKAIRDSEHNDQDWRYS